ncbi:glycosyltransferase family 2 protein [Mycoplasma cottewii]|uniref:Glycosyltransferase family 2 protein n=1 Tax=Mycoplasma cottewii TaxID=51364 RepID=A0ABY5TX22_9MOLU|nr:glycosyltransferase family 2 protein [Mycoplasma cottewii]UWD35182.1 glycosyltransferase family 2 protein [Mycoplasma cottewii]
MQVSFVISSQSDLERLKKTVDSILNQKNKSFEIIILFDSKVDAEKKEYINELFEQNKNIIISENSKVQDTAQHWNISKLLASGKYMVFVKEGDHIFENFVDEIEKISNDHNPDMIQFDLEYYGLLEQTSVKTLLQTNRVYDLENEKEVFAYIRRIIYSKAFKTQICKENKINFRPKVRFDSLFTFEFLKHSKTFFATDKILTKHKVSVMRYSAFDIINQWPHIMNYFRSIGEYKQIADELHYAYYYELCYNFINLVNLFDDDVLYRNVLNKCKWKAKKDKIDKFIRVNKIFLQNPDPIFTERVHKFNEYIDSELSKIR